MARNAATMWPDNVAFTSPGGKTVTFAEYNARVNQLCHALLARGVGAGARVAILSRNRPEFMEVFGVAKAGMIAVPLNWRLSPPELAAQLAHSRPEAIIADREFAPAIDKIRGETGDFARHFLALDEPGDGWIAYDPILAAASDAEPQHISGPDDVICLMYTSGTTGQPKGAALTSRGVIVNRWTALGVHEFQPGQRILTVMPLFHVGSMWYYTFGCFAAGATTVILREFVAREVLAQLAQQRIVNVQLVPTMIAALLNEPNVRDVDLSHLRIMFYASSSIPADLLKRAMEVFHRSSFIQAYGSTEAGFVTALSAADHVRARQSEHAALLTSCGRALPGVEMRVVNANEEPVPTGEIGEIVVRGDFTMQGYWQDEAATRRAVVDGWVHTGDLGRVDENGYYYIVDRKHDMIVSGGENVYPGEVEKVLYRDPAVLEAAVFGLPDPNWVEKVVAVVVLRPGAEASAEDIIQRARRELAGYKCPKTVLFADTLPKSAVGKIMKKTLRAQFAQVAKAPRS